MPTLAWPLFWGGSTTLAFTSPHPTKMVHTNATLPSVESIPSLHVTSASIHKRPASIILDWLIEVFYLLLIATIPVAFTAAHRRKKIGLANKREESLRNVTLEDLWLTPSWMAFFGLCDLYILGIMPTGPWKAGARKSITAWNEKRYLRRLVHMGIVPLAIQDGGIGTRQETKLEVIEEWPYIKPPKHVRSQRRPYFEFLVPMAKGCNAPQDQWRDARTRSFHQFVHSLLDNHHGFFVTVAHAGDRVSLQHTYRLPHIQPVREMGASSWSRLILPFKTDRTLQPAKDPHALRVPDLVRPGVSPLLDTHGCPLVRIEGSHFSKRRLDEWVYGMAQESGLDRVWNEGVLHAHTSEWILQNELELPEYLIPERDRI